jgi:hypothetical protein
MALDPSIALQAKLPQFDNPLNQLAQFSTIQNAQNQNQLAQHGLAKAKRDDEDTQAVRNLLTGAGGDLEAGKNALYKGGYYKQAMELGKTQLEQQKNQSEIDKNKATAGKNMADVEKTNFETFKAKKDYVVQNLTGVLTQPVITDASIAQIAKGFMDNGINDPLHVMQMVASLPPEADQAGRRAAIKSMLMGNMKADDQMRYSAPDANTVANNRQSGANNAATVGATIRGQNLVDGRSREANANGKVPTGYRANPDGSLSFIPGGPADPKAKAEGPATEDERKAAGWLVQADNAWKNMQSVMLTKGGKGLNMDTVKPGMLENSAQGIGLTQTANWLRSADRQKFVQGASSLGEALLRAATGAGMNVYEAKQKVEEITPTLNDSDEVMQQKLASIPVYIESLQARAGRAAPKGIDLTTVKPGSNDFNMVMADARRIGELRNKKPAKAAEASSLPAGWSVKEN